MLDGLPFEEVRQQVMAIMDGKLVITCNGASDFKALNIPSSDIDVFEFHNHWMKWTGDIDKHGEKVLQPISLKKLYKHYFNQEIQIEGETHSATVDAAATVRLFMEAYVPWAKLNSINTKYQEPGDSFNNIC